MRASWPRAMAMQRRCRRGRLTWGVRGCFFWLSEHAERSMSMSERSSWMEATGKGECQDATVATETFNSLPGTAFAGIACIHISKALSLALSCIEHP